MSRIDTLDAALRWLAETFSATADELRAANPPGDMVLDALLSSGYAIERRGRFAVSDRGRRRLADLDRD